MQRKQIKEPNTQQHRETQETPEISFISTPAPSLICPSKPDKPQRKTKHTPEEKPKNKRYVSATHAPEITHSVKRFKKNTVEGDGFCYIKDVIVDPKTGGKYVILQYEDLKCKKYKVYFDYKVREEYYQIKNAANKKIMDPYHCSMYEGMTDEDYEIYKVKKN